MPSKEADAHMLSTLMQVQDFLRTHRSAPPLTALPCLPLSSAHTCEQHYDHVLLMWSLVGIMHPHMVCLCSVVHSTGKEGVLC